MHHGDKVPRTLHVDHIDNDCKNDCIENLQLLSPDDNLDKLFETMKEKYGEEWATKCVNEIKAKKRSSKL